jgi:hypothetical protein
LHVHGAASAAQAVAISCSTVELVLAPLAILSAAHTAAQQRKRLALLLLLLLLLQLPTWDGNLLQQQQPAARTGTWQ